jgi:uncharacterized iron-regulated membrane protein
MTLRSFLFWPHLVAGVLAGAFIFIMSVTGALLAFEKQMVSWTDRIIRVSAPPDAVRITPAELVARIAADHNGVAPSSIALSASADAPLLVLVGQTNWLVDPYSGATLSESAPRLRRFFRTVTDWHRWLAMAGERRTLGKMLTGWANFLFLWMVMSGVYLWWPRRWGVQHVKAVTLFKSRLSGRARDFNWHNVVGFWCAVPLFFVVISAMPISFPWANALVYRIVGETPPPVAGGGRVGAGAAAESRRPPGEAAANSFVGLNAAWIRAQQHVDGWRTIALRLPADGRAPLVFTIDRGGAGQPQYRGSLTIDRNSGDVVRWEPFESLSLGRRIRGLSRFLHTGEVFGLVGQSIAGLVSLGAAVLVFTGLSLSYRRFFTRSTERTRRDVAA